MNILVLSFFPAFTPVSNGGESRLFNFYKSLSKDNKITLLSSFHAGSKEEVINHGLNFTERRIPKDNKFYEIWNTLEQYSSGGDLSAPCIAEMSKYPGFLHKAYLEEYDEADVIIHDFPFTIGYDIFAGIDNKKRIYNSHNCEYSMYKELHNSEKSKPLLDIVYSAEEKLLKCADILSVCSKDDIDSFTSIYFEHPNVIYTPHGVDIVSDDSISIKNKRLQTIFIGSSHTPNVTSANFIVKDLAVSLPNVDFHILGSCLKKEQNYPSNVYVHGFVEEAKKDELLLSCDLALNPMFSGSGANLKIFDYFSRAIPILSTEFGMRGIDAVRDEDYYIAEKTEFVSVIDVLNNNREELIKVGRAGFDLVNEKYTWTHIANSFNCNLNILQSKNKKSLYLVINDYNSFFSCGGGATRTQGLYQSVAQKNKVVFICFSENDQIVIENYNENILVMAIPKYDEHLSEELYYNSIFHISVNDIIASRHVLKNEFLMSIYNVIKFHVEDIIFEHCYMAPMALVNNDDFIHSSQNCEFQLKTKLLEYHPEKDKLITDVYELEKNVTRYSKLNIAVSDEDGYEFSKVVDSSGPIIVIRNGGEEPIYSDSVDAIKSKISKEISEKSAVFLGSGHMPNVESANFIINELAPKCLDIKFHIIGSVCNSISTNLENIKLWGIVDNDLKCAILQSCDVALNPMFSGSGSNIKLADYYANGLFVISTEFGVRGYPDEIMNHVLISSDDDFSNQLNDIIDDRDLFSLNIREERLCIFNQKMSMLSLGKELSSILENKNKNRKKILYVAYRYGYPELGGAEVNLEKFIRALSKSDLYDIDIITPEVSQISNFMRFSENYSLDSNFSAPINLPNVRFARFPLDSNNQDRIKKLIRLWKTQPSYERNLNDKLKQYYNCSGLTWGWADSEQGDEPTRWGFNECGIYLHSISDIKLSCFSQNDIVITIYRNKEIIYSATKKSGRFDLELTSVTSGHISIFSESKPIDGDARPLAFILRKLIINKKEVHLGDGTLIKRVLPKVESDKIFELLYDCSVSSRNGMSLTDVRGPFSSSMESFISENIKEYNLLITNNNVFRPAVYAIDSAKRNGVKSILIPHAHLDDDYYHFPDFIKSCQDSNLVLAVPKAACDFLKQNNCNVEYMPAGCDIDESFLDSDIEAFRNVWDKNERFIICLGRKSAAKGYAHIVNAVEGLNKKGEKIHLIMIGPDDDGIDVNNNYVTYLGRQPRNVVRGALMSSLALCNMSSSESFGIVLFEAWLAGKPVIINKNCVAFKDFAIDNFNSLMVDEVTLIDAIDSIIKNKELRDKLSKNGKQVCSEFSWHSVCKNFTSIVEKLI